MRWLDSNNRLTLNPDGFRQRKSLFWSVTVKWKEVREAYGIKRNGIIHDDNFLILKTRRASVTLSEGDANFRLFEVKLLEALPDFPADWYERIDAQPYDTPIILWTA